MTDHILITGCSGGGKTTVINALAKRGHVVVPEPGLRVVQNERASGGSALPWIDMAAFLWCALEMAKADLARMADQSHLVFYDRGLLDAAVGLKTLCDVPFSKTLGPVFPYATRVVLAPPWRNIFEQTDDRPHSFEEATREYNRIRIAVQDLKCDTVTLPFLDIAARVAFVERTFGLKRPREVNPTNRS
ncbi:MAG: AAA family ATPase [Pseudomonadota bacterium]